MIRRPPKSPLFPYPPLFRSADQLKPAFPRHAGAAPGARTLHEWLKSQVADGSLAVGARLPSTRALALDLGVSRTTVTAAYEQLAAEGYLETAPGSRADRKSVV